MEKKIEDIIHFYLGSEAICDIYQGNVRALINGVDFTHDTTHVRVRTLNGHERISFEKVKPILKPIMSINTKQLTELLYIQWPLLNRYSKITFGPPNPPMKECGYLGSFPFTVYEKDDKHVMSSTISFNSLNGDSLRYLLSQSFDLFGLIEANKAFDATKPGYEIL